MLINECRHPTPTPYPVCVLLSVNQSVVLMIVFTNFAVSKWVSAATLPLALPVFPFVSQPVRKSVDSAHQLLCQ